MDKALRNQVHSNRNKLKIITRVILFCARQTISLQGHRDDSQFYDDKSNNPGNFQELLRLLCETGNTELRDYLKYAPRNATYRSKTVQNELILICANQVLSAIVEEIREAREFSMLADEASDISNKEQLSLVLRFVDKFSLIREEFLGFLHCLSTSGEALAKLISDHIKELDLDIANCRGQGYDGAGNMSGEYSGCAARIRLCNELALYCHCQCHSLSLCVCSACKMPAILNMMAVVRSIFHFFDFSPKRHNLLIHNIDKMHKGKEVDDIARREKLKNCCRTRWVEKVDSFETFSNLYHAVVETLFQISSNDHTSKGYPWNNDSVSKAASYYSAITKFQFLMILEVVKHCIGYLRSLTVRLQEKRADISKAFRYVQTAKDGLQNVRNNVEVKHLQYFQSASSMAFKQNVPIEKPRISTIQSYRDNHPSETVSDYFKRSLTIPFLDQLISSMEDRFAPKHLALYSGFNILPSIMRKTENWRAMFKPFIDCYLKTITDFGNIDAELDMWEIYWAKEFESNKADQSVLLEYKCTSIQEVLIICEKLDLKNIFPLIYGCLKILGSVPVTTCECERSVSVLRLLKTYLRSTMGQDRFSSLALLYVRRDFEVDLDKVVDTFATRHARRMQLVDIFSGNTDDLSALT